MSISKTGGDNGAHESDFDPATITAASVADDLPDNEEGDEGEIDNDETDEIDESEGGESAADDDDGDEDEEDGDESDEESEDETDEEEDEDDGDNADDPLGLRAEADALFKDGKPPKYSEIKDWLHAKAAGVEKVITKAKDAYGEIAGLVDVLKDAEDRSKAQDVAMMLVNQIARHHNISAVELLGLNETAVAMQQGDQGTGDDDITEDDLAVMSLTDPDDVRRLQRFFTKPLESKLSAMEQALAQINEREASRQAEDGLRKAAGKVIKDVEKNLYGWKVTARMVVEAQKSNPELFDKNPRKAMQSAFPQEYAEHFANTKRTRAKAPTNGKMAKGDQRPSVSAKWDENDPDSIRSEQFAN